MLCFLKTSSGHWGKGTVTLAFCSMKLPRTQLWKGMWWDSSKVGNKRNIGQSNDSCKESVRLMLQFVVRWGQRANITTCPFIKEHNTVSIGRLCISSQPKLNNGKFNFDLRSHWRSHWHRTHMLEFIHLEWGAEQIFVRQKCNVAVP